MKKLCIKNLKQKKTTVLGLLFLAVAFFGILKFESFNIYIFFTLLGAGILLLFSPETLINSLINFVKKNDDINIGGNGNS